MLKITLPNGIVVESDSSDDVKTILASLVSNESPIVLPNPEPEPNLEPEKLTVVSAGILRSGEIPQFVQVNNQAQELYPHKYASSGRRGMAIGERENQVLIIAKMFAEEARNRCHQFRTKDIFELADNAPSMSTISSALQSLYGKRLVAHGNSRRKWWVTERGWNSCYRITAPMTAVPRPVDAQIVAHTI